ncbi:hypothetical protein AN674_0225830 [Enterobacter kobei]|nr:hypothetical protein AN674_0225830 [Enterobacter kobei]
MIAIRRAAPAIIDTIIYPVNFKFLKTGYIKNGNCKMKKYTPLANHIFSYFCFNFSALLFIFLFFGIIFW